MVDSYEDIDSGLLTVLYVDRVDSLPRSEERRVGKDRRSDWSSDVCSSDLGVLFYVLSGSRHDCCHMVEQLPGTFLTQDRACWHQSKGSL